MAGLAFRLNALATLFMTGVIWHTEVVSYPLLAWVGEERFGDYQWTNMGLTAVLVVPVMLVELATSIVLVRRRPAWIPEAQARLGLRLAALTWLSTGFGLVPLHVSLGLAWSDVVFRLILAANLVRVAAWSWRAWLVAGWLARLGPGVSGPR